MGDRMHATLKIAAGLEIATGVTLFMVPALVGQLLIGETLADAAIPVARVAGIALIGVGVACWPGPPSLGMLFYGISVSAYLSYLGVSGAATGLVLWPTVVLHILLVAALAREVAIARGDSA